MLDHRAMGPAIHRVVLTEHGARLAVAPLDAHVGGLGLPSLVLHGDRDRMYDVTGCTAVGDKIEIICGTVRSLNVERLVEFARLLGAFIAEWKGRMGVRR
ncbi:hypothetical protein [Nocardia lijiangensis]|uniref:hypothetical protein n=1 Tax=Nocardia lijiangensis TaxID=299618 RepID=UPI003D719B88